MSALVSILVPLCLAVLLDLVLGDPPNRIHPVAWMGSLVSLLRRLAERKPRSHASELAWGIAIVAIGLSLAIAAGWLLEAGLVRLCQPAAWLIEALVLKTTFSVRGLAGAARRVEQSLAAGDLDAARGWLHQHLVSRNASQLDAREVAAATVESVAENTSDSVVAPLLYYALGGLPAALAYRFLNTADAMIGYRDPRHQWLGKAAARLDDVANFVPARLTALLMLLAAPLVHGSVRQAAKVWWRDSRATASPNAGHPMSVAAGALGVELEKVGHYRLGTGQAAATGADIGRAIRLLHATLAGVLALITLLAGCRSFL
jgi:adenosylcobinamide-phosphate synthase